jgi:hypothetical protein
MVVIRAGSRVESDAYEDVPSATLLARRKRAYAKRRRLWLTLPCGFRSGEVDYEWLRSHEHVAAYRAVRHIESAEHEILHIEAELARRRPERKRTYWALLGPGDLNDVPLVRLRYMRSALVQRLKSPATDAQQKRWQANVALLTERINEHLPELPAHVAKCESLPRLRRNLKQNAERYRWAPNAAHRARLDEIRAVLEERIRVLELQVYQTDLAVWRSEPVYGRMRAPRRPAWLVEEEARAEAARKLEATSRRDIAVVGAAAAEERAKAEAAALRAERRAARARAKQHDKEVSQDAAMLDWAAVEGRAVGIEVPGEGVWVDPAMIGHYTQRRHIVERVARWVVDGWLFPVPVGTKERLAV